MEILIDVPDGKRGVWAVETFSVSEADARFQNLRATFSFGSKGRFIRPGSYKRLMRGRKVIMSNVPAEIKDHSSFIYTARRKGGDILINGLGLGVCLVPILKSDKVHSVTVIEKEKDVIDLVGPTYLRDLRVTVVCDDALEYSPPKNKRYTCVWHDIWDDICADNLPSIHKLHRKYGKRCDWQGSWSREDLV